MLLRALKPRIAACFIAKALVLGMGASGILPVSAAPVTEYIEPLRAQHAGLVRLNTLLDEMVAGERLQNMDACKRDPAIDAAIIGRGLHVQTREFYELLRAYRTSRTRRGLTEELDLIGQNGKLIDKMLDKHRNLKGVKLPPIPDEGKERIRREIRKAVLDYVERKLSGKLESRGLKDLLTSRSWQELHDKAVFHVERRIREEIEEETERIFGLRFHDEKSAISALRRHARRKVEQAVAKLLVKITSNEILLEFAGAKILEWLENDIWPRIREGLRHKGHLEERTVRSKATLEAAALRLQGHAGSARLDDVRGSLQAAAAAVHATRYLQRDLVRAGRADLKADLDGAIAALDHRMLRTEERFLLQWEEDIGSLEDLELVLRDAVNDLQKITGRNPDGTPGPASAFFVVKVAGSGFIPHWAGGSYEVTGSDQFVFELKRDEDLQGKLGTYLSSIMFDVCEIRNPGGMIAKNARPGIWNAGPQLSVVCGPFFDTVHIDKSMIFSQWKNLRDDAPSLGELKERAGCE
ncbi:hypothetical protein [Roseibium sp. Sym1]|uniref:hypothetical protein n=1 Tax=Roseibium sp. Sym1 TaxID=3016006 RepID=UPI0022B32381|nr:hypothetical protein [Roseibium sp. Sym1]